MQRFDIINQYIQVNGYQSFLEIGYYKGWSFDRIVCNDKSAVDPSPCKTPEQELVPYGNSFALPEEGTIYKVTSDQFFQKESRKWDIIFIDGLHEAGQVYRDICNAITHLSDNGIIILHDCNPPLLEHTTTGIDGCWTGDTYKAVLKARAVLDIEFFCVDTDWGVGVLRPSHNQQFLDVSYSSMDWKTFDAERKSLLNLITIEQFQARDLTIKVRKETPKLRTRVPDDMIFISAQPHDIYFQWQVEVQITNFREFGVSDKMHVLVWYPKSGRDTGWQRIMDKYKEVKFYFYQDQGVQLDFYIPQLRPQILRMHWLQYPMLQKKTIFYHDSDILFNFMPDFDTLAKGEVNYVSDTSHYLDYSYFKAKEGEGKIPQDTVINGLAQITGVSVEDIKRHDRSTRYHAGGCHYVLKNIDAKFWQEVEEDCLKIRKFLMVDINQKYFPSEDAGIQSWCADMWAVNFCLWKRGRITQTTPELDFSWATDHIDTYHLKPIFHNAGATAGSVGLFYKGAYQNSSPIGRIHAVNPNFASCKYVEAINKVT